MAMRSSSNSSTRSAARAFSLVEVLVVIAVVAVLVSLLIPTLAAAREAGRAAVCISNLRNAGLACRLYADDHRGRSPALGQPYGSFPNWALVVQIASGHEGATPGELYATRNSVLICPTVNAFFHGGLTRTYAINVTGHAGLAIPASPADPGDYDRGPAFIDMERVSRPEDTPLLMDSGFAENISCPPPSDRTASVIDFRQPTHVTERLGRFHSRHGGVGGFNSAFFDGSARIQWEVPEHWTRPLP
jgi:prepilin-type N-terminal cleavage/methylation domain-containing protein